MDGPLNGRVAGTNGTEGRGKHYGANEEALLREPSEGFEENANTAR